MEPTGSIATQQAQRAYRLAAPAPARNEDGQRPQAPSQPSASQPQSSRIAEEAKGRLIDLRI